MTFTKLLNRILVRFKRQIVKIQSNAVLENEWVMDARRLLARQKNGIIIDVGPNCGQTTKHIADAFPSFTIHCLEPNADLHDKIQKRVHFHKNLIIHKLGAGVKDEELSFYKSTHHESNSFLKNWGHRLGNPVPEEIVSISRIDTFCSKNGIDSISILKNNAEGFDFQILQGAASLLNQKKILCVLVEVSFGNLGAESATPGDYINLMESHGYQFVGLYEIARNKSGGIMWGNMLFVV